VEKNENFLHKRKLKPMEKKKRARLEAQDLKPFSGRRWQARERGTRGTTLFYENNRTRGVISLKQEDGEYRRIALENDRKA